MDGPSGRALATEPSVHQANPGFPDSPYAGGTGTTTTAYPPPLRCASAAAIHRPPGQALDARHGTDGLRRLALVPDVAERAGHRLPEQRSLGRGRRVLRWVARGAAIASGNVVARSSPAVSTPRTVVMMVVPPGVPRASNGLPSESTMAGLIELCGP